jgi:hypothetical protein
MFGWEQTQSKAHGLAGSTTQAKFLIFKVRHFSSAENDKKQLLKDLRDAPAWIAAIMREIAKPVSR